LCWAFHWEREQARFPWHVECEWVQSEARTNSPFRERRRRLLQGLIPPAAIRRLQGKLPPRVIRWEFVNLIEPDPMRRVKLRMSSQKLAQLHPADLADIMEELSPAEQHSIISSLDDETAAELRRLASAQNRAETEVMRDALSVYVRQTRRALPKGAGKYRSGQTDVSSNARRILREATRDGQWP